MMSRGTTGFEKAMRRGGHGSGKKGWVHRQQAAVAAEIRERYPHCSPAEAWEIAVETCKRGVSRNEQCSVEKVTSQAVRAYVRHHHTKYDLVLRRVVGPEVDECLRRWA